MIPEVKPPIPKEILEIEKRIKEIDTPEILKDMRIVIVKATKENIQTFDFLQRAYIKQKRKLGMKYIGGKKLTM